MYELRAGAGRRLLLDALPDVPAVLEAARDRASATDSDPALPVWGVRGAAPSRAGDVYAMLWELAARDGEG